MVRMMKHEMEENMQVEMKPGLHSGHPLNPYLEVHWT